MGMTLLCLKLETGAVVAETVDLLLLDVPRIVESSGVRESSGVESSGVVEGSSSSGVV